MGHATSTTDHDEIRRWAEERGGRPSVVRTGGRGCVLRFDFGEQQQNLEDVSWDEFFSVLLHCANMSSLPGERQRATQAAG